MTIAETQCQSCKMWNWKRDECEALKEPYYEGKHKLKICFAYCADWDEYNRRMDACAKYEHLAINERQRINRRKKKWQHVQNA